MIFGIILMGVLPIGALRCPIDATDQYMQCVHNGTEPTSPPLETFSPTFFPTLPPSNSTRFLAHEEEQEEEEEHKVVVHCLVKPMKLREAEDQKFYGFTIAMFGWLMGYFSAMIATRKREATEPIRFDINTDADDQGISLAVI